MTTNEKLDKLAAEYDAGKYQGEYLAAVTKAINTTEPDFTVQNEGSIFLIRPNNADAELHLRANVGEEAQWFGNALVVEHRYVQQIVTVLQLDGFEVK
jgi:hypothetical protein